MDWYLAVIKNYAGFSGRARRKEYWMFALINIAIVIALSVIEGILGIPGIISAIYGLALLVPSLAVGVRRLHDTGRTGWWLLLALIPLVGPIVLLVFFCMEGNSGSNDFGADPKAA
ncbi:DUF805 domain-containing protein [Marinobacter zhejiangensis]|uniref:Uncharacterized membrane protein YhaH, DUF805 family n=1 Tax=Marinobacter zhejiangensis TaxID=488535 RepID=A0A1I4KWT2_9GAMM|nr:DUF805 domain-containing protein [Marinobacter zhejiangensis]SFL83063.1 Uncharacterized membrane protein YhaH, DUF805 family [Marinobacter zhejiangensis]